STGSPSCGLVPPEPPEPPSPPPASGSISTPSFGVDTACATAGEDQTLSLPASSTALTRTTNWFIFSEESFQEKPGSVIGSSVTRTQDCGAARSTPRT